ncbi:alpha/beta fold hydrolase [Rhizobium laguerreae]|uniref:alpha/beta fold hydrolase n=2 Tax=Rhizobium laguerreae TaxID=1076926 RepID=UPI001C901F5B|nr:alpha/beta fold hydrolase [Rhizobium laguerreae]MBY3143803.1 alpha/beta fold hydrolase [Rhizobium laguerreae]MBY3266751.1 alpha/beta fold hydrolase [Rhizobium laguerreae]MBY3341655.1 alpha/beta fold hydrolase [Rhizobium laguerreae]
MRTFRQKSFLIKLCLGMRALTLISFEIAVLAILANSSAQARESELANIYQSKIVEFWNKHGQRRDFVGRHGVRIAAMAFSHSVGKNGIVISSGYGESFFKYREIVYDLWQEGYQVYILDHRGQGFSERLIRPNKTQELDPQAVKRVHDLGYVENFDDFVDDLKTFVEKEAKPANERLFLLAHSMGGAIASLYLEKFSADFAAAALSSPMHQPDLSPIPNNACWLLNLGPSKSYVWGRGPYASRGFNADRDLTSSRIRYDILKRGELDRYPQAQLGGPSFSWAYEGCMAANRSIRDAGRISVDVLLFQAGDDRVVKAHGQQKFCDTMNAARLGSCSLRILKGARHELLIEQDVHRSLVLEEILSFFKRKHGAGQRTN